MPPNPDPPAPGSPPDEPPSREQQLEGERENEGEVELEQRRKPAHPKRAKVLFHNDDYTTMEYVVLVLRKFFHKSETEALHVMLTVHKKGKAVAGVYPKEVAETKVAEVTRDARENGHPLLVTAEPE
ncbi:MAG: ATP-dependent Clp protease adaptor ClpS [Polyangiaceae bacterium]